MASKSRHKKRGTKMITPDILVEKVPGTSNQAFVFFRGSMLDLADLRKIGNFIKETWYGLVKIFRIPDRKTVLVRLCPSFVYQAGFVELRQEFVAFGTRCWLNSIGVKTA